VSADHTTCFSFLETSCSFSRRPVHQSPLASRDVLPVGPPKKAVYSLTGNASSPFHAEPARAQVPTKAHSAGDSKSSPSATWPQTCSPKSFNFVTRILNHLPEFTTSSRLPSL